MAMNSEVIPTRTDEPCVGQPAEPGVDFGRTGDLYAEAAYEFIRWASL